MYSKYIEKINAKINRTSNFFMYFVWSIIIYIIIKFFKIIASLLKKIDQSKNIS